MSGLIIVDAIDKSQMEFDFPEEITKENNPIYASENIVGRATPRHQFISGGERTMRLPLNVHWRENENEVEKAVSWLESLTYPEITHTGEIKGAPHPVLLVMGKFLNGNIYIVKSVSQRYHSLWVYPSGMPCYAAIQLELWLHKKININYKTVRRFL
ncbi:MAG: hypothetical protein KA807_19035 [Prolixibacteraceae bacterium]|nr:hypothetical protein [Prolixibacteraceae bacterium]